MKNTIWFISGGHVIVFQNTMSLTKNDFSGYIQRRLDYIFVSNTLKESLQQSSMLSSFRSFYSPILVSYNKPTQISLGKNFWKFNNSLLQADMFAK